MQIRKGSKVVVVTPHSIYKGMKGTVVARQTEEGLFTGYWDVKFDTPILMGHGRKIAGDLFSDEELVNAALKPGAKVWWLDKTVKPACEVHGVLDSYIRFDRGNMLPVDVTAPNKWAGARVLVKAKDLHLEGSK